jgi:hypothetical protein
MDRSISESTTLKEKFEFEKGGNRDEKKWGFNRFFSNYSFC